MAGPAALELRVQATPGSIDETRRRVLDHLRAAPGIDLGQRTVYAVELVLEEWLTNVFRHGGRPRVELQVTADVTGVVMRFADDGPAFDPTAHAQPARPASLDEAEPGGLGLLLIERYASRWSHVREHGRNVLSVTVDLAPIAAPGQGGWERPVSS
jgi:anti-sigma regulatory factor (Ser/Thr protein kinase)